MLGAAGPQVVGDELGRAADVVTALAEGRDAGDPEERDVVVETLLSGQGEVVLDRREGAGRRNGTGHGKAILLVLSWACRRKRPSLFGTVVRYLRGLRAWSLLGRSLWRCVDGATLHLRQRDRRRR